MTGVISTTQSTVVHALEGVSAVAQSVTRTIQGSGHAIDMFENYLSTAKTKQVDASKVELATYRKRLLQESSAEQQRFEERLMSEMSVNPVRKAHYDAIYSELAALFD